MIFAAWMSVPLFALLLPQAVAAQTVPDLTKGERRGPGHDWTLGPTGARGWMHTSGGHSALSRQILVTKVTKGSPADGILSPGDVLLGIGSRPFDSDARVAFARAITAAEEEAGGGRLDLLRWREGRTDTVQLKLATLGRYGETAPYDCPKSKRIFDLGCQAIAQSPLDKVSIPNDLNALALLASGREEYRPMLAAYARKVAAFKSESLPTWHYGSATLFLAEYVLATGDATVREGLQRLSTEIARGASAVGTWGHSFATPQGNLSGYGCMNLPGLGLLIALVTAREAGVKDPDVTRAIVKGAGFLRWYVNKGAIPYGDHPAWPGHEDNGKCSAGAILFDLLGDKEAAGFYARMATAAYDERERGHTGNFYNIFWAMPGVSRCGPLAAGAYWKEQGWYYDLARGWDGRFAYQGSPEGEEEHGQYTEWDCTGAYLLSFGLQQRSLLITGRKPCVVPALTADEAGAVVAAGREYFVARKSGYQGRDTSRLLQDLSSWSPIVRRRSAMALARSGPETIPALIRMLEAPPLNARYGACEALQEMKGAAAPAVSALQQALRHEDLWLRIRSAEALAAIGKAAMPALPDLLRRLATPASSQDPRGMEPRHLCGMLFGTRGMLGRSLEGVDRESLYAAVRNGLRNEDGQARSSLSSVLRNLSVEEVKPLLPAVLQAVVEPAPSGEMFADGIRLEGLRILAAQRIEEGIDACIRYARDQNSWGSEKRTPEIMKILLTYGARAKTALPELQKLAERFEGGEKNFPKDLSRRKAQVVRETIQVIGASTDAPDLLRLGNGTPK